MADTSIDPLTGRHVSIVGHRQARPNLRDDDRCPFCPGGLEAPETYETLWFENRWPPLPDGRAQVLLYSPEHDASMATLSTAQARAVVDMWADRTTALGGRDDVAYVLLFENRGAEVGATIRHPHGQAYAYDEVPPAANRELTAARCALCDEEPGDRLVAEVGNWRAWVPALAAWPYELVVAPTDHVPDVPELGDAARDSLAAILIQVTAALDAHFGTDTPLMMWIHQRPTDDRDWPNAHLHLHITPIWRAAGVPRFVAAAELGSDMMFNPIAPADAAADLRARAVVTVAVAPGRVNLIGDHTDYVGGLAMPCAIDLAVTAEFESADDIALTSDATAEPAVFALPMNDALAPDATMWHRLVHAVASLLPEPRGAHGRLSTTLPIGAGLSSSAVCTIALALALGFEGDARALVLLAQAAEHKATGVPCGVLDQLAITHGEAGHACLVDAAAITAELVPIPPGVAIVVISSGHARALTDTPYAQRRHEAERAMAEVGGLAGATVADALAIPDPLLRRRARHVITENERVRAIAVAFAQSDMKQAGALMSASHASLKNDAEVSTKDLDQLVDALSSRNGVYGARLTGAGFGGSAIALAASDAADALAETFGGRVVVPSAGARVAG